ncbi:hypothetical protein CCHL11_00263 [Colletotrichum chlorophyti]|uniref:G-protein coupled receptors family 1 profile domain-containing protein n=1 Tax=Colletotrichum chlorophyti TaxID=708187 RepID=A0A1Q8RVN0_9PEZI|nr:hypothetical protein CCHL11_00263 [Colletotrichum chlorophyti]
MYSRNHTLSPLPSVLQSGLKAIVTLSCLSLVTSFTLLIYLSGRLAIWYSRTNSKKTRAGQPDDIPGLRYELGGQSRGAGSHDNRRHAPNQFLVLLLNVLLADTLQACAFFLNVVWLAENRITDDSPACWAQGWFLSTGDLASVTFIAAIAVHTYLTLVRGYKMSCKAFYATICLLWFFVIFMSVLGVMITRNGADVGGFYVRDIAWCWINSEYEAMRLYLHYLWMLLFILIGSTSYILVFLHVRQADKKSSSAKSSSLSTSDSSNGSVLCPTTLPPVMSPQEPSTEVHKRILFLLYPVVFLLCTAPLALGRILSTGGVKLSPQYLCFAGAMITSNGWIDVLIFSTTRSGILFDAPVDEQNLGLDTFNLTALGHQYGHRVWIQGGRPKDLPRVQPKPSVFRRPSRRPRLASEGIHDRSESQTSLHEHEVKGIQMETVTTVFVEDMESSTDAPSHSPRTLVSMHSEERFGEREASPLPFRQIRAFYDDKTITVYQAYNSVIAKAAVDARKLNASPSFKLSRMTWIKPSWAWMLYRSGYSYKDPGQERILAIKMTHEGFINLLRKGVLSHGRASGGGDQVRIQWDPERSVRLERLQHRSIQIGIPAGTCESWVEEGIVGIEDVTARARELKRVLDERPDVGDRELADAGLMPVEREFAVPEEVAEILEMSD